MIPEQHNTPIADKSRMLPSPPALRAGAPMRERETERAEEQVSYRDRQRDLNRDLNRDLPRETVREPVRDPLRDGPRDIVREALDQDTYQSNQPVTREITRDIARDMGRDLERGHSFDAGPSIRNDNLGFEPGHGIPNTDKRRKRQDDSRQKSGSSGLWIGTAALALFLGGSVIVADAMHEQIVAAVPDAAGIYEALGYKKIISRGLDFADVTYAREIDNGVTVLAIRGQIVNVSDREVAVPKVRVTVRDADKRDLYQWTFAPDTAKLTPKGRAPFATRLESPPPDAWDLEIRFAKAGE